MLLNHDAVIAGKARSYRLQGAKASGPSETRPRAGFFVSANFLFDFGLTPTKRGGDYLYIVFPEYSAIGELCWLISD